jgi:hypothetical protein
LDPIRIWPRPPPPLPQRGRITLLKFSKAVFWFVKKGNFMLGITCTLVQHAVFLVLGCLIAAAFAGFSLLKFYEEFRKGVEQKSRLRIWSAFFGLSFVLLLFFFILRSP